MKESLATATQQRVVELLKKNRRSQLVALVPDPYRVRASDGHLRDSKTGADIGYACTSNTWNAMERKMLIKRVKSDPWVIVFELNL